MDSARDRMTCLVRMAAGTAYPRHIHAGPEECLVLEGELRVGDEMLRAGDYQRAAPGSHHPVQSTDRGCLLLIVSSLSDELED
jgi:anti-sigma factor ChrR (cupin superfamily)